MSAIEDIAAERERQILCEGWTTDHDDCHRQGEMARAAACYALHPFKWNIVIAGRRGKPERLLSLKDFWPWSDHWWKPKDRRRDLVRAGALIVAEIERLDRLNAVALQHRVGEK